MGILSQLTFKSKLALLVSVITIFSILVVAFLGWWSGKNALNQAIFNQLTSVRASKAYQIETYFETIRHQAETLSEDRMIVDAMLEFKLAYSQFPGQSIAREWEDKIETYYKAEFLSRLAKQTDETPILASYVPQTRASQYLQYHYMANNPFPVGDKDQLVDPLDGSVYSEVHAKYHLILQNFLKKFGYYDLFLIDFGSENIVYSVFKETDFAQSLLDGPYRDSNLAQVVSAVKRDADHSAVKIVDFEPYAPSYAAPAAFVATPIYRGARPIGILAMQLPVDRINDIMTGNRNWESDGLGESGETYLVGPDYRMRSISRFLIEDREGYTAALRDAGQPETNIQRIEHFNTSILLQSVETEGAIDALARKTNTRIIDDYRHIPVLSSYAPLEIEGLNWAILSEIDVAEAFEPVARLEKRILISSVVLVLVTAFLAASLSSLLLNPIDLLIAAARKVGAGDYDVEIERDSHDELGELVRAFNDMVKNIRSQSEVIEQQNREYESLMLTILPEQIAKRRQSGEERIADHLEQIAVVFVTVVGMAQLGKSRSAPEVVDIRHELADAFDKTAEPYDVEKVRTIGDLSLAVCGLSRPHLDHAKCAVDFAAEFLDVVQRLNRTHKTELSVRIGINAGEMSGGIVGTGKSPTKSGGIRLKWPGV